MTITEFLEARIAEDEKAYGAEAAGIPWLTVNGGDHWARLLATCRAHRAIVERCELAKSEAAEAWNDYSDWIEGKAPATRPESSIPDPDRVVAGLEFPLRALASIYADHPDFDPDWS